MDGLRIEQVADAGTFERWLDVFLAGFGEEPEGAVLRQAASLLQRCEEAIASAATRALIAPHYRQAVAIGREDRRRCSSATRCDVLCGAGSNGGPGESADRGQGSR